MIERVEVCIVGYDASDTIAAAIGSVALIPHASVAFVEHSADDSSLSVASRAAADGGVEIRTSHDATNPGFGAGVNRLVAGSSAEWLVFLNPDAEILEWPWSDRALPPPRTVIGGAQVSPSGAAVRAWGRTYRVRDEVARSWLRRTPPPSDGDGFVGGAAMLVHRSLFEELGGFDEQYFLFYEDIDFCARAVRAGCRVEVAPDWVVRHALGASTRRNWTNALTVSYQSGRRFHAVHGHSVRGYDVYMSIDAAARAAAWSIRRTPERAAAHRAVFASAARHAASLSKADRTP